MKFSILLPTRNGGHYLKNCIQSVLEQDYENFELIISDNANTDDTPQVLSTYENNPKVKILRVEEVVSVTENWNNALHGATGDYLLMLGDDDSLLPNSLKRLATYIEKYQSPDCLIFNGYSYIAPDSIAGNQNSLYGARHFRFGDDFREGIIDIDRRRQIVKDMFSFRVRIPLNMQTTVISRRAAFSIPGGIFVAPFPDHFALNSLLLKADTWAYLPDQLVVVGVSPKSFGHYVYSNQQQGGLGYLGSASDFPGKLPGNELTNGMHRWLLLLLERYPEDLAAVSIDRGGYVSRQVYSWFVQLRSGGLSFKDFIARFSLLGWRDWFEMLTVVRQPVIWRKLHQAFTSIGRSHAEQVWHGLRPIPEIRDIREFCAWISTKQHQNN